MFHFFRRNEKSYKKAKPDKIEENFSDVTEVARYFESLSGITFSHQLSILESKIKTFCRLRGIHSYDALLQRVKNEEQLRQEFIDYLTTNETFFYRELAQIEELVRCVDAEENPVKILCAPSASGEESYSIAIALLEGGVSAEKFHILGIDINQDAILKAKEASYKERSVQNLSLPLKERYFTHKQQRFHVKESLKQLVSFEVVNIFDEKFLSLGKFDYIFCRNMLIYFDDVAKQKAKAILQRMLKDKSRQIFFGHADLL